MKLNFHMFHVKGAKLGKKKVLTRAHNFFTKCYLQEFRDRFEQVLETILKTTRIERNILRATKQLVYLC